MNWRRLVSGLVLAMLVVAPSAAQVALPAASSPEARLAAVTRLGLAETSGTLFENVVALLAKRFVDADFRAKQLPALAETYRPRAEAAQTLAEQRAVVQEMLSHVPATHLGRSSR